VQSRPPVAYASVAPFPFLPVPMSPENLLWFFLKHWTCVEVFFFLLHTRFFCCRGGAWSVCWWNYVGVQVDYNVVHLRTSLVQLFVLLQNFEKLVQMIELRFGGAPNGYPFAPLKLWNNLHGESSLRPNSM
jgi:hypothetical protein